MRPPPLPPLANPPGVSGNSSQTASSSPGPMTSSRIPTTVLVPLRGTVVATNASSMQVTDIRGQSQTIKITSDTRVVKQGAPKDPATLNAEFQTFAEQTRALTGDITANRAALEELIAPSPFVETPVALSTIQPGNVIIAYLKDSVAVKIIVTK